VSPAVSTQRTIWYLGETYLGPTAKPLQWGTPFKALKRLTVEQEIAITSQLQD